MKKLNALFLMIPLATIVAVSTGCPPAEGEGEGEGDEGEGEGEGDPPCTDDSECLDSRAAGTDPGLCAGTCVDPDTVTGVCGGGTDAPAFAAGPVIIDAESDGGGNLGDPCADYTTIISTVYSEVAFDSSLNSQRLKFYAGGGDAATGTYSQADLLPAAEALGAGFENYYTLTYYLCGDGADGAVQLTDNDSNEGNAFCF